MKDGYKKSKLLPILFATITITFAISAGQTNITFGQAVDLIPIQTGNATLDKGLPEFYDCIEEKIDASKGVEKDPYFEKEPTKNEMSICYNEVFFGNIEAQSNDEVEAQSNEESIASDIERFNSLFGVIG